MMDLKRICDFFLSQKAVNFLNVKLRNRNPSGTTYMKKHDLTNFSYQVSIPSVSLLGDFNYFQF